MAPTVSPTTPTRTSINIPFQRQTTPPRSYVSNKRTSTSNDPSPIEPATTPTYTTSSRNPLRNGFDRAPDTQEDDGKVKRSLQIDMKSMVGDSVGNVNINYLFYPTNIMPDWESMRKDEHKPFRTSHSTSGVSLYSLCACVNKIQLAPPHTVEKVYLSWTLTHRRRSQSFILKEASRYSSA